MKQPQRYFCLRWSIILLGFALIFVTKTSNTQVRADEPIQAATAPITSQNAKQLTQLGTIGTGRLTGSAWSPDGTSIAYTTPTGVWLISRESGDRELIASVENASYPIFSNDSLLLAWTSFPSEMHSSITIWDIEAQKPIFEQQDLTSPIIQLVFAANGEKIYSGNKGGLLQVWDIKTVSLIQTENITQPTNVPWRFFIRPNQELIVNKNNEVWRYDAAFQPVQLIAQSDWSELDPSGQLLAISSLDGSLRFPLLRLYDLKTNNFIKNAPHETFPIRPNLRWDTTGTYLIFQPVTGSTLAWDIHTNTWKFLFPWFELDWEECTQCFNPFGQFILSRLSFNEAKGSKSRLLEIHQLSDSSLVDSILIADEHSARFCTSYTASILVSQLQKDPQSVETCESLLNTPAEALSVLQVSQSRNAEFVAGTNTTSRTFLWQRKSGQMISIYETGESDFTPAFLASFSADGHLVAMPRTIDGFQIANTLTGHITAHFEKAYSGLFSPTDDLLFTLTQATDNNSSGYLRIYNASSLATADGVDLINNAQALPLIREIPLKLANYPVMNISPDGQKLVIFTGIDLRIVDVATGQKRTLSLNYDSEPAITSLMFTNDGSALIYTLTPLYSGQDAEGRLVIQNASTGENLKALDVGAFTNVALTENGQELIFGSVAREVISIWGIQ